MTPEVVIRALTPALLPDYLSFFDGPAFADNPHWAACYCFFHHNPAPDEWETRTAAQNRAAASEFIQAGAIEGFLAYRAEQPVAWCKAAPRLTIPALAHDPKLVVEDAEQVGSFVCFIVASEHRRAGVAVALLQAACEALAAQGLSIAEAYPRNAAADDASNFRGPLTMYTSFGFKTYRKLDSISIVRKAI